MQTLNQSHFLKKKKNPDWQHTLFSIQHLEQPKYTTHHVCGLLTEAQPIALGYKALQL